MSSRYLLSISIVFFFGLGACSSGDNSTTDAVVNTDPGNLEDNTTAPDEGPPVDTNIVTDPGTTDEGSEPDLAVVVDEGNPIVDAPTPTNCTDLSVLVETPVTEDSPVALDIQLCNVVVTYKHNAGYFIQQSVDGPATEVYVGSDWPYPAPAEGEVLHLRVSQWASYQGHQEITASEPPVTVGNQSIEGYALDLSSGILPSEALESRLVTLTGATVREVVSSKNYLVDYGTAEAVNIYVTGLTEDLCPNATFDVVRGVFIQYGDLYEIKVYFAGFDITNIDTGNCAPPVVHDDSNWGFESWLTTDPPEDFLKEKQSQKFAATQEGEHVKQGSNACVLTWYTTTTAELAQGWWMPAEVGTSYTFSLWAWDEAATGRIRTAMKFYDADKNQVGDTEYSSYTADEGTWTELTATSTAPEGAVTVRGAVRMYDEGLFSEEDGADVYIDEWSLAPSVPTENPPTEIPGE